MKKLTKKQRRSLYLQAAEYLSNEPDLYFLCGILRSLMDYGDCLNIINGNYHIGEGLIEFDMFEVVKSDNLWWESNPNPYDERITCMILCAEMC